MSVRVSVSWLALALAGASGGCENVATVLEDKAERVAEEVAVKMSESEGDPNAVGRGLNDDERLARKLRLYIECRGRASERIRDSWRRYDERIGKNGTLRKKGTTPFLYKIDSELRPCEDAVRRGPTMEPPLPHIERAMAAYVEHGQAFAELSVELDAYFEQKAYADDGWAKGKELAPRFTAAFAAWSEASQLLDEHVSARQDVVDRKRLVQLEQHEGKNVEWHARHLVLEARAFARCVSASEEADAAEGCRALYTGLVQADADFRGAYEAEEARAELVFWMSSFRDSTSTFVVRADEYIQGLGKGPAKPDAQRPVQRAFDALVSDSNNLRFDR